VVLSLADQAEQARSCVRCPLSKGRTQVVFGVGNPKAELMFVGEGPGEQEDLQGEPFVGKSGKFLDKLVLEELGETREQFYIANVVKCLRYSALVQLADGSWERIGRLVRNRYAGRVMAVDAAGRLVTNRVTGWHESALGDRRVFRLSYRSAKRVGGDRTVSIELTGDHPVLTDHGYVPVQELPAGARIATGQGLSQLAHDVVCGTLLGDGHINKKSASLSFSHCFEQPDYAAFKADCLTELTPHVVDVMVAVAAGAEDRKPVVMMRTLASRALRTVRADWYTDRKIVPEGLADGLTARMLAFWFMDDGYLRVRGGNRRPLAEIATFCFGERDLEILLGGLRRLGLAGYARRNRLFFNVSETRTLSELIAPYVVPSMRYKLVPEVAGAIPFDPSLFISGPAVTMYDEVDALEITDRYRGDKTFFCIDVEDTHNFVTGGGVVHNCRPPGNRDPLPEEIEACRPWLEEQLDTIDPKVVVTLGNFASKLLLNTKEGITKLRGKTYPYRRGVLVPTYHPAAVLRGGGEAQAQMRADLVRAKRALREFAPC
jgi:uracil-DNA glycosylase